MFIFLTRRAWISRLHQEIFYIWDTGGFFVLDLLYESSADSFHQMWTCGRTLMDSRIQKLVQTNILFTGSSLCQLFFVNSVIFIGVFQHSSLYSSAVGRRSSHSDSCLGLYNAGLCPVSTSAALYSVTSATVGYDIIRSHFCIAVTSPCFALINHFQHLTSTPQPYSSLSRSVKHTVESFTFDFLKAMTTRLLQTQTGCSGRWRSRGTRWIPFRLP